MKIPFVDLKAQYLNIQSEIDEAIRGVLNETAFIMGSRKEAFERDFAAFCRAPFCVGVGSGTDALYLALKALGVGPGDEVITVSHTFIATAEAISAAGATPRFVDVEPDGQLMNPALIEEAITPRTKAIVPVHLFGQMCEMTRILAIADRHGLVVLEDAAQAHAAEFHGKRSPLCQVAAFSFYPGKNLGAYGDAGAVVTHDNEIYKHVFCQHDHGRPKGFKHEHPALGFGYRMDALQAAILHVKLRHLERWTDLRRKHAARYRERLQEVVTVPHEHPNRRHVYHLYPIRTQKRTALQQHLQAAGISTGIHYPIPAHLQPCYGFLGYQRGALPVTEQCADQLLSLPMYADLTDAQVDYVCDRVLEFFQK
ncbi:MAG: DegT/DnrJ/EryC1/StrS family aminotransferase [Verrucomicrobia bacterium]|nr:DegT/DnrJ/EryC1/StrS family aminotransferase [Verrucomicrobiota bacterium]